MERDTFGKRLTKYQPISTHTLTWSVTWTMRINDMFSAYFNSHAHVERDEDTADEPVDEAHFNSHAHVERDPVG